MPQLSADHVGFPVLCAVAAVPAVSCPCGSCCPLLAKMTQFFVQLLQSQLSAAYVGSCCLLLAKMTQFLVQLQSQLSAVQGGATCVGFCCPLLAKMLNDSILRAAAAVLAVSCPCWFLLSITYKNVAILCSAAIVLAVSCPCWLLLRAAVPAVSCPCC